MDTLLQLVEQIDDIGLKEKFKMELSKQKLQTYYRLRVKKTKKY